MVNNQTFNVWLDASTRGSNLVQCWFVQPVVTDLRRAQSLTFQFCQICKRRSHISLPLCSPSHLTSHFILTLQSLSFTLNASRRLPTVLCCRVRHVFSSPLCLLKFTLILLECRAPLLEVLWKSSVFGSPFHVTLW